MMGLGSVFGELIGAALMELSVVIVVFCAGMVVGNWTPFIGVWLLDRLDEWRSERRWRQALARGIEVELYHAESLPPSQDEQD